MPHLVLQNCLCKSNVIFLTSQWGEHSLVERYLDSDLLVILLTNLLGIWLIWVLSDSYVFCVHTYLRENCLTSTNKQRKASWCQNLSCSSQVGRSILRIAIRNCCYIYIYTYLSYTLQNERTEPKKKGRNLFISRRFPDSFWVECSGSGSSSSPWFCAFEMFGEQMRPSSGKPWGLGNPNLSSTLVDAANSSRTGWLKSTLTLTCFFWRVSWFCLRCW